MLPGLTDGYGFDHNGVAFAIWDFDHDVNTSVCPLHVVAYSLCIPLQSTRNSDDRESALPIVEVRLEWQSN